MWRNRSWLYRRRFFQGGCLVPVFSLEGRKPSRKKHCQFSNKDAHLSFYGYKSERLILSLTRYTPLWCAGTSFPLSESLTDKRSFWGGNQKSLHFFTPQRGRIDPNFEIHMICAHLHRSNLRKLLQIFDSLLANISTIFVKICQR